MQASFSNSMRREIDRDCHGYGFAPAVVSETGDAGTGTVTKFRHRGLTAYPYRGITGTNGYFKSCEIFPAIKFIQLCGNIFSKYFRVVIYYNPLPFCFGNSMSQCDTTSNKHSTLFLLSLSLPLPLSAPHIKRQGKLQLYHIKANKLCPNRLTMHNKVLK